MSLSHHLIGNAVVLVGSCDVVDPLTENQTPTDPTTVTFYRKEPDGTLVTYVFGVSPEVTHLATGIYACTVTPTLSGREKWRYETTGTCEAAAEHEFDVLPSSVLP